MPRGWVGHVVVLAEHALFITILALTGFTKPLGMVLIGFLALLFTIYLIATLRNSVVLYATHFLTLITGATLIALFTCFPPPDAVVLTVFVFILLPLAFAISGRVF
jgi:hypothetical protein